MHIGNFYFSFTNPSLFMLLTLSLVLLLLHFVTKNGGGNSVPNAWQSLVELIYDFVPNLVNEQIGGLSGNVKQKFFPRISFFSFLLHVGVPMPLAPFLVLLELIPHCF
uniref:F-ATPase protein 6 n=1 Tax=Cucumis melo TaxID=3656 RepID=A0A9I9EJX2_CUCME